MPTADRRAVITRPDPDGPDLLLAMQLQDGYARAAAPGSKARDAAEAKWRRAYFALKRANPGVEP